MPTLGSTRETIAQLVGPNFSRLHPLQALYDMEPNFGAIPNKAMSGVSILTDRHSFQY